MRKSAVSTFVLILLFSCAAIGAQKPLTAFISPTRHDIAPGEIVTLKVFIKNNLSLAPPLVLVATTSFFDDDGSEHISTASFDLTVSRPIYVGRLKINIPSPLVYVPDTAAFNGQNLAATPDGQYINVLLNTYVAEQQTVLVTLDVTRPK